MESDVEIGLLVVAVLGGVVAAYALVKGMTALLVAAIFGLGTFHSPVARDLTSTRARRAAAKLALYVLILIVAAWGADFWIDFSRANPDSETFMLVAVMVMIGTATRMPMAVRLARLSAWEPGFVEEYERTPLIERPRLVKEWTRLRPQRAPG